LVVGFENAAFDGQGIGLFPCAGGGIVCPFNEFEVGAAVLKGDLDAGDASRMHAGAGVVIDRLGCEMVRGYRRPGVRFVQFSFGQGQVFVHRTMGVPGNDDIRVLFPADSHLIEPVIDGIRAARIGGGPGGVFDPASLQIGPEVAHEEFTDGRAVAAAFGICLVTVPEQDAALRSGVRDRRFMYPDIGENGIQLPCVVFPLDVVVAPDLDVAGFVQVRVVELFELIVDRGMGDVDLIEGFVFPEFFGIAQFDVGKALLQVMVERAFVDERVVGKVVTARSVAPMHVGHDDEPGVGGDFQGFGHGFPLFAADLRGLTRIFSFVFVYEPLKFEFLSKIQQQADFNTGRFQIID